MEPSNSPRTKTTPETTAKRIELMQKRSKVQSKTPPEPENKTEPIIESPPRTVRETVDLMSPPDETNPANESNIHNRAMNRQINNQTKTNKPTTGVSRETDDDENNSKKRETLFFAFAKALLGREGLTGSRVRPSERHAHRYLNGGIDPSAAAENYVNVIKNRLKNPQSDDSSREEDISRGRSRSRERKIKETSTPKPKKDSPVVDLRSDSEDDPPRTLMDRSVRKILLH